MAPSDRELHERLRERVSIRSETSRIRVRDRLLSMKKTAPDPGRFFLPMPAFHIESAN